MPRLRRLALVCLALLSLFVIAAGAVVVRMLPHRLAEWDVARVTGHPAAPPRPPLAAVPGSGGTAGPTTGSAGAARQPQATPAGVTTAVAPLLTSQTLGPHVGLLVTSLATGQVLYSRDATTAFAPASTTKVATAVAALDVLGPAATFSTRVVTGATPGSIVLVGGGDPTLAAARPPASDYPHDATLQTLAARTARALKARHQASVRLGYDVSLFTGPGMAPGWKTSYVTTGNVTPISPLEVDQGRLTPSGRPQDADDAQNGRARTFAPASRAAHAFAAFLRADGIAVAPAVGATRAAHGAAGLASVSSPSLDEIVAQMLAESNNVIAENLARHVAIATGRPASFGGAASAEEAVLSKLGVHGLALRDGSGLSPLDRITPVALVRALTVAAGQDQGRLRAAITGLPVAGFSGTLAPGGSAFASAGPAALGVVRAKTGNLTTVADLAGLAYDRDGQLLAFAVMADQFKTGGLDRAGDQMARLATALAACGCRASG